jgi:predicted regulator of Ras-like GTPase activity (Roadblock/LC7/MglB family)
MSKSGLMVRLRELVDSYLRDVGGDVLGIIITNDEGLPIMYRTLIDLDVNAISALYTLAANQLKGLGLKTRLGDVEYMLVSYSGYVLYAERLYGDLTLIAVASKDASIGVVMYVTGKYAERFNESLRSMKTG